MDNNIININTIDYVSNTKTKNQHYIDESLVENKTYFEHVKSHITCSICEGLLNNPLICASCETPYCEKCILTWKEKNNSCPSRCTPPLVLKGIFRMLKNTLDEVKLKCKICTGSVSLSVYGDHLKQCSEKHKTVTCWNCESPMVKQIQLKMKESEYLSYVKKEDLETIRNKYEEEIKKQKETITNLTKDNDLLKAGRLVNNLDKDLINSQMNRTKQELDELSSENKELKSKFNETTRLVDDLKKQAKLAEEDMEILKRNNRLWEEGINEHIMQKAQLETLIRVREQKLKEIEGKISF